MKGITIIVILSIVWSIISSIIEKRQKAQKEKLKAEGSSFQANVKPQVKPQAKPLAKPKSTPVIAVDPEKIRVEALRRRRAQQQKKQPEPVVEPVKQEKQTVPEKGKKIQEISKLHQEVCPVPPTEFAKPKKKSSARQIADMLKNRRNLRTAIVLSEILQKPVSLR